MRSNWEGSNVPVTGIDGISPKRLSAKWTGDWHVSDIYFGKEGSQKYVPMVEDLFHDTSSGKVFIITAVDPVTYISSYRQYFYDDGGSRTELLNLTSQPFVVYYDTSRYPYRLALEGTHYVFSDEATVARIYRGTLISPEFVISRNYDNSGNFTGHDIPLVAKKFTNADTDAIKIMPSCMCTETLKRGEEVTVVFYGSDGRVIKHTRAVIFDSTFMVEAFEQQLYIKAIGLRSAFVSDKQPDTIAFPVNYTMDTFNPIGYVEYNDGRVVEYPVDGRKFTLSGLDRLKKRGEGTPLINSFISTLVTQRIPLILRYNLDPGEAALGLIGVNKNVTSKAMDLLVVGADYTYGVKIFTYPEWVDKTVGYRLKHYLLHIERNMIEDVTSKVRIAEDSVWDPKDYGSLQNMTITLELNEVMPNVERFKHVQKISVILRNEATSLNGETLWEASTQSPSDRPLYGTGLRARFEKGLDDLANVFIDNGMDYDTWYERVYLDTQPLWNPEVELRPITPTHVDVRIGTESYIISIKDFDKAIKVPTSLIKAGAPVRIFFYQETGPKYLVLSMANMALRSR